MTFVRSYVWMVSLVLIVIVAGASLFQVKARGEKPTERKLSPHHYRPSMMFLPEDGCVPDDTTAIKIAEAVWVSVYGESVYEKRPFNAELLGDTVWAVAGSLPTNSLGGAQGFPAGPYKWR